MHLVVSLPKRKGFNTSVQIIITNKKIVLHTVVCAILNYQRAWGLFNESKEIINAAIYLRKNITCNHHEGCKSNTSLQI